MNALRSAWLYTSLGWLALLPLVAQEGEKRTWTSRDGRRLEASLVAVEDGGVRLRLADGKVATVPWERLSPADVDYARAQAAAPASKGGDAPAPPALSEWPRSIDIGATPVPEIVVEDAEKKEFIYRSGRYEFHCDSKLTSTVVREFSRIFEATYLLNCSLPLDLKPRPEEDGQAYFIARLYTNAEDYFANGGLQGSAGVYQRGQKALAVPLSSLGVKIAGSRVLLENSVYEDNRTLIHEITHQMMNHWLSKLPVWYVEGSAEFVEMLEYDRGKFNLASRKNSLRDYVERGTGGREMLMLDPEELFGLDSRTWSAALASLRGQAGQNYLSAGIMTYYLYFLDGEGDSAPIIAYLRELEEADASAEPAAFAKHLMRGRSPEAFKDDLLKAFRSEGISLRFDAAGKNEGFSRR